MKPPKTRTGRIGATLVLLIAAAFLGAASPAPKSSAANAPVSVTPAGSHLIGNPQAPVRLVEYISYTCSHCAAFDAEGALPLQTGYLATGKVLLEVRHWPRDPIDLAAAALAGCGDPAGFPALHHALMQAQPKLVSASVDQVRHWMTLDASAASHEIAGVMNLYAIGAKYGVDRAHADRCFADTAYLRRIAAQGQDGSKLGVKGTPAFFINGLLIYDTVTWGLLQPQLAARLP